MGNGPEPLPQTILQRKDVHVFADAPALPVLPGAVNPPKGDTEPAQSPYESLAAPRLFLEIFAGEGAPITTAFQEQRFDCFTPVDLKSVSPSDILDDAQFQQLCALCSSGLVGAAWANMPHLPQSQTLTYVSSEELLKVRDRRES